MNITKEYIRKNYIAINGDLRHKKFNKDYPFLNKEDFYKIYTNKSGYCEKGHKLKFQSFRKGYGKCKICEDLKGFYNLEKLKEHSKENIFTATQVRKIKEYYNLSIKEIYLWNNKKEYCSLCGKEKIFINQVLGYAKTCSTKCGNNLERRKLSHKEEIVRQIKKENTNLKRYGVKTNLQLIDNTGMNNPIHKPGVLAKMRKTKEDKGIWVELDKCSDLELYRRQCEIVLKKQDLSVLEKIEKRGDIKVEGAYHLDHMFSIKEGFLNSIPPCIIGNINNLKMIPARDNVRKSSKCSINKEELFKRFFERQYLLI